MTRAAVVGVLMAALVTSCSRPSDPPSTKQTAARPDARVRVGPARRAGRVVRRPVARSRPRNPALQIRELPLSGQAPSSYVAPTAGTASARPVLVLLHGAHAPRAGECRAWGRVAARRGWVLCPAGLHRPKETDSDRWTWGKVAHLVVEIRAGLAALEKRYPGRVDRSRLTLAGFSLGSLLAHEVAYFSWGMFPRLILVEGVAPLRRRWSWRIAQRGVRRVAYVCGERSGCGRRVKRRRSYLKSVGITVKAFTMPGVGHGYPTNFAVLAEQILSWVSAEKRPSVYRVPRRR